MTKEKYDSNINIVIINGSVRENNNTIKASNLIVDELNNYKYISVNVINPAEYKLSFPGIINLSGDAEKIQKIINGASGVVIATPEYHGSFSGILKLVIENLGFPSALSGKPIALLGVASGRIGAVKSLEHLRSICSHVGGIVLPGPISIPTVDKYFDEHGNCTDPNIEKQIRSVAKILIEYIKNHICPSIALEQLVRNDSIIQNN